MLQVPSLTRLSLHWTRNDNIIYETSTGALHYDADGDTGYGSVQFAILTENQALTDGDFILS